MLKTSVGEGGGNSGTEVKIVQILLNQWLGARNGELLKIDGIVGSRTIGAIKGFQADRKTGSDGRIDPSGPTLKALLDFQIEHARSALESNYNGRQILALARRMPKAPNEARRAIVDSLRAALAKS